MKAIVTAVFIASILLNGVAQNTMAGHNSYFSTGLKQIKENANYGLVFTGPNLKYGFNWVVLKNNKPLSIQTELGASVPFSKGIPALNIYLKPAEVSWLAYRDPGKTKFSAGPMLKLEYDYTLYPQLQSAFDYWFTNFSLGINSSINFRIDNQILKTKIKCSFLGLTSRQPDYRNPYWYDIGFQHAVRHLNSDLKFSGPGKFNTSSIEITWKNKLESRFIWTYLFNYAGYFEKPSISIVNHTIRMSVTKKQHKL